MPVPSEPHSGKGPPDKISIVVYSGDFDKVHYALVMASAARAVNLPVTLFFTMEATRALMKPADAMPGWHRLPASGGAATAAAVDRNFGDQGVATFEELLSACVVLGVRWLVCEMGLRVLGLSLADLRDDVPVESGGVVTFIADASRDGAMLFL
ncbi:MAG: DsrE/DsrF/DrsH-like family protein [Alphaproteobacteria bacterium]|nr:DsrE/DsrF/DrsH-like family protein [Alphaproteobacteria bacterium]